jgi:hypothetical protein
MAISEPGAWITFELFATNRKKRKKSTKSVNEIVAVAKQKVKVIKKKDIWKKHVNISKDNERNKDKDKDKDKGKEV